MNNQPQQRPHGQSGQAMVEYIVVTLMCVLILFVDIGDGPVIHQLKTAIKTFFGAYSHAISIAPQMP